MTRGSARASVPGAEARRCGYCYPCGKQTWPDRKAARRAHKAMHPGEQGLAAYRCPHGYGWHFGHHSPALREQNRAVVTADE